MICETGFQIEGDEREGFPVEIEVGAEAPIVQGGKGVTVENVVFVGVYSGVVAVRVEVSESELGF